MRVVDTSAWVEWLIGSAVGHAVEAELPDRERWIVPTIVQYELARWLARESDEETAIQVTAFAQLCVVAALDTAIALSAADIAVRQRLAMADAIVYATVLEFGADLLTCDRHFDGLSGVRFLPKRAI
jgi:predicted nucleic acid-binding protein